MPVICKVMGILCVVLCTGRHAKSLVTRACRTGIANTCMKSDFRGKCRLRASRRCTRIFPLVSAITPPQSRESNAPSDKAPTNKICRRASSEQRPRTRYCHESEFANLMRRVWVLMLRTNVDAMIVIKRLILVHRWDSCRKVQNVCSIYACDLLSA